MKNQSGVSIFEVLIGLGISSFIFGMALNLCIDSSWHSSDNEVRLELNRVANSIINKVSNDLLLAGSGMPLSQSNFNYTDGSIGAIALPVITANSNEIHLKYNPKGFRTYLTSSFNSGVANSIQVLDTSDFQVDDIIFLSNLNLDQNDALKVKITSIDTGTKIIGINSFVPNSSTIIFDAGTTVNRISTIEYLSNSTNSSIERSDEYGTYSLANNTSLSIKYVDSSNTYLSSLPLSNSDIANNLKGVEITVTATASKPLSNGNTPSYQAKKTIVLKNLL